MNRNVESAAQDLFLVAKIDLTIATSWLTKLFYHCESDLAFGDVALNFNQSIDYPIFHNVG